MLTAYRGIARGRKASPDLMFLLRTNLQSLLTIGIYPIRLLLGLLATGLRTAARWSRS